MAELGLAERLLYAIEATEREASKIHRDTCRTVCYLGVTEAVACDCGEPDAVLRRCSGDRKVFWHHSTYYLTDDGQKVCDGPGARGAVRHLSRTGEPPMTMGRPAPDAFGVNGGEV